MINSNPSIKKQYSIIIRDLEIMWNIGVFNYEYEKPQKVIINVNMHADEMNDPNCDDYQQVACYANIVKKINILAKHGHIKLVETLGHRIGLICLEDKYIQQAVVRVEKPEALENTRTVGVEITRSRGDVIMP